MQIIVKGEVDKVDAQKEVFALPARKELEAEWKWREKVLSGAYVENSPQAGGGRYRPLDRVQDIPTMRKEMKDYKRNFERGMPIKLSPVMENALWKKAKRLKDEFVIGMVSKTEMHPVKTRVIAKQTRKWDCEKNVWGSVTESSAATAVVCDYDKLRKTRAIERNDAWQRRNQTKINEFKKIMRLLEPDDPNIANIERFRPV